FSGAHVWMEHLQKHRDAYAWFVTNPGYASITRIQKFLIAGFLGQGIIATVVVTHPGAIIPVRFRSSVGLDPGMFIRWHSLLSYLTTDPFSFFGQDNPETISAGS